MKFFKQILSFLLVVLSIESTLGQDQVGQVFTDFTFQHTNSNRSKWEVFDNNGTLSNSAAATLRRPDFSGGFLNFGQRYPYVGTVVIRFNTCNAAGKTFTVKWNTYNTFGGNVNSGTFQVTIQPPPPATIRPNIVFNSINAACSQVSLCVSNSLPDASYAWSNANNGAFMASGICATFNTPPPAQVRVVGTCGIGPNSAADRVQAPPAAFTPGVLVSAVNQQGQNQTNFIQICQFDQITLNGNSNSCINNANNWVWSSSGGSISNQQVSSGSTASAVFDPQGVTGTYQVQLNVTDFMNGTAVGLFNIQVLPQSDPFCNNPALRKPKENSTQPTSLEANRGKLESMNLTEDLNTEGVKSDVLKTNSGRITSEKKLYPNPAKDFLTVEDIGGVEKIQIIDLTGKVIRIVDIEQDEIARTLNVSDLTNGMYILKKIKQDGQLEATKFQVIH